MQQSGPNLPNLGQYAPDAANEPGASADLYEASRTPTWPGARDRPQHALEFGQAPRGYVSATACGISLGANVVLLASLLTLLLLSHAGISSPGGAAGQSAPGLALSSPAVTSRPTGSPSPGTGWLQVAPSSVQLGCDGDQGTQTVVLQNTGPETVKWQATFAVSEQQAGVSLSPQQGELAAGDSVTLQLQNTTRASGRQGTSGRNGVISFAPKTPDAGASASLTYTTVGCH